MRVLLIFLLFALGVGIPASAYSQDTVPAKPANRLPRDWDDTLTRAQKFLLRPDITDEALEQVQATLLAQQKIARKASEDTRPEIETLKGELSALGSPPADGVAPEADTIAQRRKEMTERLAAAEAVIKEADLLITRADQILERVTSVKRIRFTERIIARGLSPLAPAVWRQAGPELTSHLQTAWGNLRQWVQSENIGVQLQSKGWRIPAGVLMAILLAWPLRLWLLRRFGYVGLEGEPTYRQRLRVALFTGFVRSLLPSAAVLALYLSLLESGLLAEPVAAVLHVGVFSLIFVFFSTAFCWAALAPTAPYWRLVPISDQAALAISRVIPALTAVFAIDWLLNRVDEQIGASIELVTVQEFLSGLVIAGLLFALLRRHIWQRPGVGAGTDFRGRKVLRVSLAVLVLAIPLTACLGYVALSRLLATQLVQSGGLFVLLVLLGELGGELIEQTLAPEASAGADAQHPVVQSADDGQALAFWLKVGLRLMLVLTGIFALPLIWGVQTEVIAAAFSNALTGFQIGPVKLSLLDLFWAVALFSALLVATRLFQRTLDHQIFPRTRLDGGVRNSIRSAVGYTGFALAAIVAISALGLDLSNLAIIAGALSVGVGLGLQNIVSNFVSGIILLVERPIKTGDWVVVGDYQGYVKKISVRATELTTFDRGSVFIPNSNLVANPVMNRTYADPQGRVIVPVGVAYGTDSQKVRRVLLDLAGRHTEVLRHPPPLVLFRSFGDSALQFELVAYLADVNRSLSIASDLCFAIYESFAEQGITFPFPQRDVSLRLQPEQVDRLLALQQPKPPEDAPTAPSVGGFGLKQSAGPIGERPESPFRHG